MAGAVTLVAGLLVLFNANDPPAFARLSVANAIAISLPSALFFLFIAGIAVRTQRQQPKTGREGMIGAVGEVRTALSPRGTILVHGEIWRAEATEDIESGSQVVVDEVDGFTLKVRRTEASIEA